WGQAVSITASPNTGSHFTSWTQSGTAGTFGSASSASTTFTMGKGNSTVTAGGTYNTYTIGYTLNGGTAGSSAPTSGTYASAVTISNPTKTVTVNGSVGSTGCANSSSSYTASSAQTFAGWTSSTLSSTATTASSASGTYSAWNGSTATTNQYFKNLRSDTGTATMVATWTPVSITLPQISRTGYTCKWNYGGNSYDSGASYTPAANSAASLDFTATATIKSNLSLKVSFNSTYVSSVKVCKTTGDCSGTNLMGTVTTSGNSVSGLTYGTAYYLYPTYTTGSYLESWTKDSGAVGTLSSTSAANPTYTIGDGTNAVTLNGKNTYSLTINFAGTGINSVRICKGGNLGACKAAPAQYAIGEITASGGSVGGLSYGASIGLLAYTDTGYSATYTKTAGAGSLINQNIFTVGAGNGTLTATGKASAMQTWTASDCLAMTAGDITQLDDLRDSETYYIGKLADGNCWMLDNLRLDLTNSTTISNTTADNTNATAYALTKLKSGGGTTSDRYATTGLTGSNWTKGVSYSAPLVNAAYKNTVVSTVIGQGSGKQGVYYNYCAASAGSHCWGNGTSPGTVLIHASEDICPKGWRLPTGTNSGEYQAAYYSYGSNRDTLSTALSDSKTGDFYNTNTTDYTMAVGYGGSYHWTSSTYNSTDMYRTRANTTDTYTNVSRARYIGSTVRCVFDKQEYLQNATPSTIDAHLTSTNKIASFRDSRDNEPYLISKLADGNYWYLDNMRLNLSLSTTLSNVTASNTNATDTSITKLKSGGGTTSDKYPTAKINNVSWTSSSQNYYSIPMSVYTFGSNNLHTVASTTYGKGSGRFGVYYNFCAASAGSYCYGNGTSAGTSSGNATEDLCPTGWRLPTGNTTGEYQSLYTAYSSNTTNFLNAISTSLTGHFNSGTQTATGYGNWWTSTRNANDKMYDLHTDSTPSVSNSNAYVRSYGFSIRCVKDNSSVPTMQSATTSTLAAAMPNEGDKTTLRDSRDNKTYEITKVNGQYWMTQNLRFVGANSAFSLNTGSTNIGSNATVSYGDLTSGNSNDEARIHAGVDNNGDGTVWYNYAAATAGTITGSSNSTNATYDICPAGWRLPTQSENSGIMSYAGTFNPVAGGIYYDGTLGSAGGFGFWWSATASSTTSRYRLVWDGSGLTTYDNSRSYGFYVRCVKK
ncbi:hypothetical protein J5491_01525, partial [Candidatus Saccharibacteria bacterium]|nr:hypothetical protein [Candidatus Saccharibacteria bacterium]